MASQDARLSKFEVDFKRQQGTLPSDTVKNPKLNTSPVLSARSYPTINPQCSSHPSTSINAIKAHSEEANISQTSLSQTETGMVTQQPKEHEPTIKDEFQDLHLNLPVLEVLAHVPIYNAILDKYIESLELGKNGSAFIQGEVPAKMEDPRLFTMPCKLGDSKPFDTLADLGSWIEELVRAEKLSHLIKEIKQGRDQTKVGKKESPAKDKSLAIYMVQLWHRTTREKVTQSFSRVSKITFAPLTTSKGTEGPLIIEVENGEHIPGQREIQAVSSTAHGMLKFLVDRGIVTIRSTILIPAECATVTTSSKEILKEAEVRHENFKIALHLNFPDKKVAIRGTLSAKGGMELCSLLKENLDIFAWQLSDMTGVPRSVTEHRLNIREGYSLVRQKKGARPWNVLKPSKRRIVTPFLKSTGTLNLSVATPLNVSYMLTKAITKYRWQSQMKIKRLSTPAKGQIGQNIEVYVDDLVIRSYTEAEMLRDIDETFLEGMFLGYMISPEGIKPCPDKTEAVLQLSSLRTIKEVHSINGKLASLNRFLPKSAEKSFLQAAEAALVGATPAGSTHTKGGTNCITVRIPQSYYIILGEHNITYWPRTSMKGQILVDFLFKNPDEAPPDTSGVGLIQTSLGGTEFTYALRFQITASNNEAEYEALIAGLWIAAEMGVCNVNVSVDSKLVANQMLGTYVAKEENTVKYLEKAKTLISGFANFSISQVPRSKNKKVDALSKITSTSFAHLSKQVLVKVLKEKPIQEEEVATLVEEEGPTWMTPIIEYLKDGTLPDDEKRGKQTLNQGKTIQIIRRGSLQAVIPKAVAKMCLRSMVDKAMRLGYFWPTMQWDARDMIRTCNNSQIHHPVPRNPKQPLTPIMAPWSFYKWGIDIAGPFPEGPGKVKFLIVSMDYFMKWIEVKAMATITRN
ncbi:reverse transcriptase domain-containing protein [Tanacetum coccineum]|uniref:Reverse transcriptase domain-containing protein n=1 Tax=Tanacetum coccineum TaxID=301880 RepID=A0ABQ4XN79_9ASTR